MKAIRKRDKVIVDVVPYPYHKGVYKDKNSDELFIEEELEFIEYYGG
jgi:hypothetical protein